MWKLLRGIEVLVNSGLFSDSYSEFVHSEKCFYTSPAVPLGAMPRYWALFMIQFMLVQFICTFISSCSQH